MTETCGLSSAGTMSEADFLAPGPRVTDWLDHQSYVELFYHPSDLGRADYKIDLSVVEFPTPHGDGFDPDPAVATVCLGVAEIDQLVEHLTKAKNHLLGKDPCDGRPNEPNER